MERWKNKSFAGGGELVGLQHYILAARPDAEVHSKIMEEKHAFYKQYGQNIAIASPPHITIVEFMAREEMEETIFRYMQRILKQQECFETGLNNYSGVPPHSVYLRVQNPNPFIKLAKDLAAVEHYINSCYCPPVTTLKKPHIIIARHLPETLYQKAMMDYSQKTFYEKFIVDELVLLRKSDAYDTGKILNVFRLQPATNTVYN